MSKELKKEPLKIIIGILAYKEELRTLFEHLHLKGGSIDRNLLGFISMVRPEKLNILKLFKFVRLRESK